MLRQTVITSPHRYAYITAGLLLGCNLVGVSIAVVASARPAAQAAEIAFEPEWPTAATTHAVSTESPAPAEDRARELKLVFRIGNVSYLKLADLDLAAHAPITLTV